MYRVARVVVISCLLVANCLFALPNRVTLRARFEIIARFKIGLYVPSILAVSQWGVIESAQPLISLILSVGQDLLARLCFSEATDERCKLYVVADGNLTDCWSAIRAKAGVS